MVALTVGNTLISEVILIVLIGIVLFIIFKMGRGILKLLFGIIINSVLGIIAIFALNYFFNLGIPITQLFVLIPTALFGLPAVGTFVILRFFGVALAVV